MINLSVDLKQNFQYNFSVTRPCGVSKSVSKSVSEVGGKDLNMRFLYEPHQRVLVGWINYVIAKYPIITVCRSDGIGRRASFRD